MKPAVVTTRWVVPVFCRGKLLLRRPQNCESTLLEVSQKWHERLEKKVPSTYLATTFLLGNTRELCIETEEVCLVPQSLEVSRVKNVLFACSN